MRKAMRLTFPGFQRISKNRLNTSLHIKEYIIYSTLFVPPKVK